MTIIRNQRAGAIILWDIHPDLVGLPTVVISAWRTVRAVTSMKAGLSLWRWTAAFLFGPLWKDNRAWLFHMQSSPEDQNDWVTQDLNCLTNSCLIHFQFSCQEACGFSAWLEWAQTESYLNFKTFEALFFGVKDFLPYRPETMWVNDEKKGLLIECSCCCRGMSWNHSVRSSS